jgi:hypothetical protein
LFLADSLLGSLYDPEDGSSIFFQNASPLPSDYIASHIRRQHLKATKLYEYCQIMNCKTSAMKQAWRNLRPYPGWTEGNHENLSQDSWFLG